MAMWPSVPGTMAIASARQRSSVPTPPGSAPMATTNSETNTAAVPMTVTRNAITVRCSRLNFEIKKKRAKKVELNMAMTIPSGSPLGPDELPSTTNTAPAIATTDHSRNAGAGRSPNMGMAKSATTIGERVLMSVTSTTLVRLTAVKNST